MYTPLRLAAALCLAACIGFANSADADDSAAAPATAPAAAASAPSPAPTVAAGAPATQPLLLAPSAAADGGACAPADGTGSQEPVEQNLCGDCDSPQNSCTSGVNTCANYCLDLVGQQGFCQPACKCCVCPEQPAPPPPSGDPGVPCQSICRCDGQPGPQGGCPNGCRQVNCV